MILFDLTEDEEGPLVGFQKSNFKYTYLHWNPPYGLHSYGCPIDGKFEGIHGVGPTSLVGWKDD